jgi:glucose/arabinose dehydrogenase
MHRVRSLSARPGRGRVARTGFDVESLECRALLSALPPGFQETVFAQGFDTPTAQAFAPDGRLFVTEKAGNVRVVKPDGTLLPTPFLSLSPETTQDRGLVGLALDPKFNSNGYVYLWWTKSDAGGTRNRLSRFTRSAANPNVADPDSELVLIESPHTTNVHTGGAMGFGADGMFYLGVGDGGVAAAAQDLNDLRGKVLRLNVADPAHLVPSDNPFVGQSGKRPEIWAYGFRNPFSGAMKPWTNLFFVNDVGEEQWEEVNKVQRGGNFGWPVVEGKTTTPGFVNPVYSYAHTGLPTSSAAITGGVFYSGTQFPAEYRGDYFFGDYINRFTRRLDTGGTGTNAPSDFGADTDAALDYDVGPDGSLYYLSAFGFGFNGENRPVYKISWVGTRRPGRRAACRRSRSASPPPAAATRTATR